MKNMIKLARVSYVSFMNDSLYRNSSYLLINLGVMAGTGFLFVLICTKLYSQQDIGYATALIGALALATGLANLGMSRTLVRFLAVSETKIKDIITMLSLVLFGSLVVGVLMTFFFRFLGLKNNSALLELMFVISVALMSVKVLFENIFIAILDSVGVLIENLFFSVSRLLIPFAAVGFGYVGIFSSQLVGAVIAVAISAYLLKKRGLFKLRTRPTRYSMKGKWRFAFGSYTTDLVGGLPASFLPIIVVAKLGPVDGSLWYVAMQIVNFLLAISSTINQVMFAEMANSIVGIRGFVIKASIAMYGLVVPLTLLVYLFAPQILRLFSGSYVSATNLLRIMSVFALIGVANYITGSILAFYKKTFYLTMVNTINATVVILYCLLIAHNITGIAIGWMLGEVANVVLFVGGAMYVIYHIKTQRKLGL